MFFFLQLQNKFSFESQCQTKPYERALTRLRLADPKHPSFESLLVELYSNFNLCMLKFRLIYLIE
jgi:hypothetical protein